MSICPSPEQQAAIDCTGNVVITARPGSGKTFTLARMIARDSDKLLSYQGVIAISYTNKASDELKVRCDRLGVERMCSFFGTIDKFCIGQIVGPFIAHLTGQKHELELMEDEECPAWISLKGRDVYDPDLNSYIMSSLNSGKMPIGMLGPAALLILDKVEQARKYIQARYTSVFIDEYQDCGLYQHQMLLRLVGYGLRGVAVGDIDQAIFRFTDKSPEYLSQLMKSDDFSLFEITKNHRCDRAIQAYSRALLGVPVNPNSIGDRRVFAITIHGDEGAIANDIHAMLERIMMKYDVEGASKVAILGCSNATLNRIDSSLGLPSKRYASTPLDNGYSRWRRVFSDLLASYYEPGHFAGDILDSHLGPDAKPSKRNKGFALVNEFYGLGEDELANNVDLAVRIAKLFESDSERNDDIDAYEKTVSNKPLMQGGFRPAQQDEINILTYHKAKGLEFDVVFCLETYQYIMPPTKYWEKDYDAYGQFLAMHYVGITRAKKACYILLGTKRHRKYNAEKDTLPSEFLGLYNLPSLRVNGSWPVFQIQ